MRVFGWLGDHGGCGWYRVILPLGALRHHGVTTRWSGRITDSEKDGGADVIVAQRVSLDGPTKILRKVASCFPRPKIVYELDDDLLAIDEHNHPDTIEFYTRPEIRANILSNLRLADMVTVSTEPLAQRIRQFNENVVVLPNCIPADLLGWNPGHYTTRFTVGWQGSSTHRGDWMGPNIPIESWFERARLRGLPVELHTLGSQPDTLPSVYPHRHTEWSKNIDGYYRSIDWHVALAPLANTKFNQSKSDLRVLEAAALGIPVIASNVVAYREGIVEGETGFLARRPQDWGKYLDLLSRDHELRMAMSDKAREYAAGRTIEDNAQRWLDVYNSLGA